MAKNIGATLSLKDGNFFTGLKSASSAADNLKNKLLGTTSSVSNFNTSTKKTSGIMPGVVKAIAGVTAACISLNSAVNFGKSVVEIGSAYQDSVAKVSTIADTTVKSLSELSSETIALSSATGVAASDINESLYQAISAGADTAHATELVGVAVKAAKGGFTDTTTAVDGLTSVLNTYGMATSEAQSLANQFLITQNKGKTSFGELATTIGQVAPVAKSSGVSINELLSGVASLTANGLSTSSSMTGLKAALSNIIKPTSDAQKMAQELGIDFSTTALQAQGLSGFVKTLAEKTGGSTDKMAKLFGSVEGLNAMLTLTSSGGMKLMADTMTEMQNNTTALDDAYGAMTNTVTAQMGILKNKLSNMKINIFEQLDGSKFVDVIKMASAEVDKFVPVITNVTVAIGEGLFSAVQKLSSVLIAAGNGIVGVINHWNIFKPIIAGVAAAIGAYKSAVFACNIVEGVRNNLITIATVLTGSQAAAFAPLTTMTIAQTVATSALSAAQSFLNAAFIASPIGWIVVGIGAVVGVFTLLWNKCEGFRNFWKGLWSGIKTAVSAAWSAIQPAINAIKNGVGKVVSYLSGLFGGIKKELEPVLNAVKETVSEKLSNIKNAYTEHGGGIKGIAFAAIEGIKGYYTAGFTFLDKLTGGKLSIMVNTIKEKLSPVKEKFSEVFQTVKPVINELMTFFRNTFVILKTTVVNIFNGIKTNVVNFVNSIKEPISGIINGIKSVFEGIKTVIVNVVGFIVGILTLDTEKIKSSFTGVISGISTVFSGVKDIIVNEFKIVVSWFTMIFENVKTVAVSFVNAVSLQFNNVKNTITNVFTSIKDTALNVFENIKLGIVNKIQQAKDLIVSIFEGVKSSISNVWNGIKSIIKTPHIVQEGTISIAGINTPIPKLGIKWYADGGIMTRPTMFGMSGGNAHVGGEAGPEAILPLKPFWDKLDNALRQKTVSGGKNEINIDLDVHIEADNRSADELADAVINAFVPKLKTAMANL